MRPYGSAKQLEKRRQRAIQLLEEGKGLTEAAQKVGSSISSVWRWNQLYQKEGREGLKTKPIPGRPCKMTKKQKQRLAQMMLKGPKALGYPTDLWTCRRVTEVIQKNFGITYHHRHLWWLLTHMGWSHQKPQLQAKERNEKEIAHWKRYRWPHIKKG